MTAQECVFGDRCRCKIKIEEEQIRCPTRFRSTAARFMAVGFTVEDVARLNVCCDAQLPWARGGRLHRACNNVCEMCWNFWQLRLKRHKTSAEEQSYVDQLVSTSVLADREDAQASEREARAHQRELNSRPELIPVNAEEEQHSATQQRRATNIKTTKRCLRCVAIKKKRGRPAGVTNKDLGTCSSLVCLCL